MDESGGAAELSSAAATELDPAVRRSFLAEAADTEAGLYQGCEGKPCCAKWLLDQQQDF